MSLRAFVLGVVALAAAFFFGLMLWPSLVMSSAIDGVTREYEAAGIDVSECKKQFVKQASCLKKPMAEIARQLDQNGDDERRQELREQMERELDRVEEPPLD